VVQTVLAKQFGVELLPVPYKGDSPVMTAMLGGEVDFATASPMLVRQNLTAGKFKVLAVSGDRRSAALPDVPTVEEAGLKHDAFSRAGAITVFARRDVKPEVLEILGQAFAAATHEAKPVAFMQSAGLRPLGLLPKPGQQAFDAYFEVQKRLVQSTGVKLD
jgi:tripartite-type tricarboxylate transporter receptor subunit TctC